MKLLFRILLFVFAILILIPTALSAQSGPYLGETPPVTNAKKFKPDGYLANNAWVWQGSPTFSPDGNEMYFVKYIFSNDAHEIWYTKSIDGQWQPAQKAPFTKSNFDSNPFFLSSNDTLYFNSDSPDGYIFQVTRTSTGWSDPAAVYIPIPANHRIISFSIAKNKTIYFAMMSTNSSDFKINYSTSDIYLSKFIDGAYTQPQNLGASVNSDVGEGVDYIDPDEKFLIFSSLRSGGYGFHDIYISIKNSDGSWNSPVNLGAKVNTGTENSYAQITPDGQYLFFITFKAGDAGYSPYWIQSKFIFDMLTDVNDGNQSCLPGKLELLQNYPNPFNPSTTIKYVIPWIEAPNMAPRTHAVIKVYDLIGNEVAVVSDEYKAPGIYEEIFDGAGLPSGIYFCSIRAGKLTDTIKLVMMK